MECRGICPCRKTSSTVCCYHETASLHRKGCMHKPMLPIAPSTKCHRQMLHNLELKGKQTTLPATYEDHHGLLPCMMLLEVQPMPGLQCSHEQYRVAGAMGITRRGMTVSRTTQDEFVSKSGLGAFARGAAGPCGRWKRGLLSKV